MAYRVYRAATGGKNPTSVKLNDVVKTSLTTLCKAARVVETKLAALPDLPEELQTMLAEFQATLWSRTQELGNAELLAYRRSAEMEEQRHRREIEETLEILDGVEAQRDAATRRADGAKATVADLRDALATTVASLASANARIEELRDLFAVLSPHSTSDPEDGKKKPAARNERRAPRSDDPGTGDLPGTSPPASCDAAASSA